jgi:hypothetical protein
MKWRTFLIDLPAIGQEILIWNICKKEVNGDDIHSFFLCSSNDYKKIAGENNMNYQYTFWIPFNTKKERENL